MLRRDEVGVALSIINKEGWGYSPEELQRMLDLDPEGSFVFEDGNVLGVVTCTTYGRTGVLGHLVVSEEGRGRRIGDALVRRAMSYMEGRGAKSMLLFATEDGARIYKRHGFTPRREVLCLKLDSLGGSKSTGGACERMQASDLNEVVSIDSRSFGDDRGSLIQRLYHEFPEHCYKYERDGQLASVAFGRKASHCLDVGPWFCMTGSEHDASAPLNAVLSSLGPGTVYMGVFKDNLGAVSVTKDLKKSKVWTTVLMIKGEPRYETGIEKVFAIPAFELG